MLHLGCYIWDVTSKLQSVLNSHKDDTMTGSDSSDIYLEGDCIVDDRGFDEVSRSEFRIGKFRYEIETKAWIIIHLLIAE